jgi:hypothetical protein
METIKRIEFLPIYKIQYQSPDLHESNNQCLNISTKSETKTLKMIYLIACMQLKGDQHLHIAIEPKNLNRPGGGGKEGKNMFVRTSSNLPVNKSKLCYLYYIWLAHC